MNRFSEREFRQAMGRFCTGVVVVTGMADAQPQGFTAQSFVSLSLDPPLVSVCPALSSTTWPRIRSSGHFGINILAADQQGLCARFARSGGDKFDALPWTAGLNGAPRLEGVLGFVECAIHAEHAAGDHSLVIGRVLELHLPASANAPLLFYRGRYGSFDEVSQHAPSA